MKITIIDTKVKQSITVSDLSAEDKTGSYLYLFLLDILHRLMARCVYVRPGGTYVEGNFRFKVSANGVIIRKAEQWNTAICACNLLACNLLEKGADTVTIEIVEAEK